MQQPCECHLRERLPAFGGQTVQVANLLQLCRGQGILLQEPPIVRDSAIGRNPVQISVGQQSLIER